MDRKANKRSDIERMFSDAKALPLSFLEEITNDFSDDREIGSGGFAVVYKGVIGNRTVAVKRLSKTHMYEKEFHREVECLMKVKHKNVVRFLGYCADTQGNMETYDGKLVMADVQQRLLCFEYLPNGSLHDYITDASRGLEWRSRYEIIRGISEGLHYLHRNRIVHLDLKPSNVLLDNNMVPKIADFGLSRCFDENQIQATITKLVGTYGYLAPEFYDGKITLKTDIYSLGVIIMEIVTGAKGYNTVENVLESWRNRLDKPQGHRQLEQVRVCAEIGIECTDSNPAKRPDPQNIIDRLDEVDMTDGSIATGLTSWESGLENSNGDTELGIRAEAGNPVMTSDIGRLTDRFEEMKSTDGPTATSVSSSAVSLVMARDLERVLLDETAGPVDLSLFLLEDITNGFSDDREIGQGGFAVVYKGMLGNGTVAVKKLVNTHMHEKEFNRQVECLMKAKHKNILRFLGYCAETRGIMARYNGKLVMADVQQRLLCFEYLPKGSLDNYITDASCGLDWRARYQIVRGICDGLYYLHRSCILHLDLHPSNILLDDNIRPKVGGFGLSRCFDENQTGTITTKIVGTMAYLPPEFSNQMITYKYDLYSLGVIITELLTGKKGHADVSNVLESWRNRLDKSKGHTQLEQVRVCAEIAIECMDFNPDKRPDMRSIIDRLDETESMDGSTETGVRRSS